MNDLPARISAKIAIRDDGCWMWTGAISPNGYGRTWMNGRTWVAHRLVYTVLRQPVDNGLDLDHLCRNRACVNPEHLEPVTRGENLRRAGAVLTHCPQGHPYAGDNVYLDGGTRRCKICNRAKTRRYHATKADQQRLSALQNANRIRSRRSQLKRDLKAGRVLTVDILVAPPEWAESMKVIDLLMATPKCGRVKANKILKRTDSSPSKSLGGLSGRQRKELVVLLGGER